MDLSRLVTMTPEEIEEWLNESIEPTRRDFFRGFAAIVLAGDQLLRDLELPPPPPPPPPPPLLKSIADYDALKGVMLEGAGVAQWDDQSGNGHHAVSTAAARPTLRDGAVNYTKARSHILATSVSTTDAMTIFVVGRVGAAPTAAGDAMLGSGAWGPNKAGVQVQHQPNLVVQYRYSDGVGRVAAPGVALPAGETFVLAVRHDQQHLAIQVGDNPITTVAHDLGSPGAEPFVLGGTMPHNRWDGGHKRVIFYDRALSDDEIAAKIAELAGLYRSPSAPYWAFDPPATAVGSDGNTGMFTSWGKPLFVGHRGEDAVVIAADPVDQRPSIQCLSRKGEQQGPTKYFFDPVSGGFAEQYLEFEVMFSPGFDHAQKQMKMHGLWAGPSLIGAGNPMKPDHPDKANATVVVEEKGTKLGIYSYFWSKTEAFGRITKAVPPDGIPSNTWIKLGLWVRTEDPCPGGQNGFQRLFVNDELLCQLDGIDYFGGPNPTWNGIRFLCYYGGNVTDAPSQDQFHYFRSFKLYATKPDA